MQVYRYTVREALDVALCMAAASAVEEHPGSPGLQQLYFNVRLARCVASESGPHTGQLPWFERAQPTPGVCNVGRSWPLIFYCKPLRDCQRSVQQQCSIGRAPLAQVRCLSTQFSGLAEDGEAWPVNLTNDIDLVTIYRAITSGPDAF